MSNKGKNIFKNMPFDPTTTQARDIIEKFQDTPWEFKEIKQYSPQDAVIIFKRWVSEETPQ